MAARPGLVAAMIREESGVADEFPVALEKILEWGRVRVEEVELAGFLGLSVPPPLGPAMLIADGQSPEQRRFTIAHELGHLSLPKHAAGAEPLCLVKDFHTAAVSSPIENEANEFAADLLMPRFLFAAAVRDRDPTFELVSRLADKSKFWVSRTAAAIRMVELTQESCVLVCSERGRVKWWKRSPGCGFYLERDRGAEVPPGSLARAVVHGETGSERGEEVDPGTWFNPGSRDIPAFESTLHIPSFDQVLSIIWTPDSVEARGDD